MGKNSQLIKLFVVLFFGTAFIFSFSHYGAKAFENWSNADGKFSPGTKIGSIDISGKTRDEAATLLEQGYVDWVKDTSFIMQYGEKKAPFDLDYFHLDTNQTVNSIKNGQTSSAFITIDKKKAEQQIQTIFPQITASDLDMDKLVAHLNTTASEFETGSFSFDLFNDYASHSPKESILSTAVIDMQNVPMELEAIIDQNHYIEIPGQSTFSLLDFAKKQRVSDSSTLSVIATGVYQTVLPSNFAIIERNISTSLPDYASLGYEAKVDPDTNDDLVIANPNKTQYRLEFQLNGNQLHVALTGENFPYTYKIMANDKQSLSPKTIVQYSPMLSQGQIKILTPGESGQAVKLYRDTYQNNQLLHSELVSQDYYPPVYQIEVHGLDGGQKTTSQSAATNADASNNSQTADHANAVNSETSVSTDEGQSDVNNNDLWGKPNEQPK